MMAHRRRTIVEPGAIARSFRDRGAIVTAFRGGERGSAVSAMRRHIERIHATDSTLLEGERGAGPCP